MSSLLTALQSIPDHRSARGKRYPLWVLLVFIVMGNLAGYRGNRPLAEFAQRYGRELTRLLQVELKEMPCFSTFRRVHLDLDFTSLCHAFRTWMEPLVSIDEEYYAIDGKRIRQPIAGADGKTRFVGLVSVFAHQQGITVDLASLSETENSELSVVQYLIEKLQLGSMSPLQANHAIEVSTAMRQDLWHVVFSPLCP
jgi:hypothetical protein